MLKFARMQAEVLKFIIDLGPVPARYSNLYSVFYIWWCLFPFVYVYVVTLLVNSFILSLSGAFFLFIFTQHLYILSSTFSYIKLKYSTTNLLKFYLYSWKCNKLIWLWTHSSCLNKLTSSLYYYDGVSFPLYMFRWQLEMLIIPSFYLVVELSCLSCIFVFLARPPIKRASSSLQILIYYNIFIWKSNESYTSY